METIKNEENLNILIKTLLSEIGLLRTQISQLEIKIDTQMKKFPIAKDNPEITQSSADTLQTCHSRVSLSNANHQNPSYYTTTGNQEFKIPIGGSHNDVDFSSKPEDHLLYENLSDNSSINTSHTIPKKSTISKIEYNLQKASRLEFPYTRVSDYCIRFTLPNDKKVDFFLTSEKYMIVGQKTQGVGFDALVDFMYYISR